MTLDSLWKLAAFLIIGWVVWKMLQPRCAFVLKVVEGVPTAVHGTVTPAFLQQVQQVCSQHGVQSGIVRGLVYGRRISLTFSKQFPPEGQQQLRNWWAVSGWLPVVGRHKHPASRR